MKTKIDPLHLAFFTALAVTVFVVESFIPKPLPFLKLGLANTIVLLMLWEKQYFAGFVIIIAKTIIGGLFSGMLISPMTVISLTASIGAFIIMLFACIVPVKFSIIGISICGAGTHNVFQLLVVNIMLINSPAVWKLLPVMILLGIFTGIITGYLAHYLFKSHLFFNR